MPSFRLRKTFHIFLDVVLCRWCRSAAEPESQPTKFPVTGAVKAPGPVKKEVSTPGHLEENRSSEVDVPETQSPPYPCSISSKPRFNRTVPSSAISPHSFLTTTATESNPTRPPKPTSLPEPVRVMKPTFLPSAIKVLAVEPAQEQRSNTTLPGTCTSAQPLPVHTSRCPAAPDVQHDKTCEAHESLDPSPCTKRSGSDSHARSPAGREEATLSCFSGSRQSVDSLSPSPLPHSVPSIDAPTIVDQGFAEKTAAVDDGGPSHIVPGSAQGSTQLVFEAFSEESIKALIVPAREAFETSPESYALPDHRSSTAILPPQLSANAPIALKQDSTRTKAEPGASPLSLSFSPSFKGRRELALVQQDNSNTAVLSASPHAEVLEASPSSCAPSERRSSTPVPPSTSFQFQADEDRAQDAPTPVVPFDPPTRRHKEKQFLISHESSATADSPKSSRYVGPSTPISPPSSIQNSLQTLSPAVNEVAQHLSSHVVFGSNETRQATRNEDHAVTRPTQICKALGTQESTTEAHRQDACGDKQASPREPPPQTTVSTGPRDTPLPAQSAQQYLRSDSDILSPAREGRAIATTHNGSDALPAILTSAKSPSSALSIDLIERVSDLLSRHSATEGDELPSWAPIGQLKALLTCIGGSQDDISDTTESAAVSPTQDSNPRDPFMSWNFRGANMIARDVGCRNRLSIKVHIGAPADPWECALRKIPYSLKAQAVISQDGLRSSCLENTRSELLDTLRSWVSASGCTTLTILGPLGTGKTAVANTLAAMLVNEGVPGGVFFCDAADSECADAKRILPTLAMAMTTRNPTLQQALTDGLRDVPHNSVGTWPCKRQIDELIVAPLRSLESTDQPYVFIIDGLEQCLRMDQHHAGDVEDLLAAIQSIENIGSLVKFIVVSQPDEVILRHFERLQSAKVHFSRINMQDVAHVHRDIEKYLRQSFQTYAVGSLRYPKDWPPSDEVDVLVARADGLFVYAAICYRYVTKAIDAVGSLRSLASLDFDIREPATLADRLFSLYRGAVRQALNPLTPKDREAVELCLGALVCMQDMIPAATLSEMLSMSGRSVDVLTAFKDLQAVIVVPTLNAHPVYAFHWSFLQFLQNEEHAQELVLSQIHLASCHRHLADACIQALRFTCDEITKQRSKQCSGEAALAFRHDSLYGGSHWIHHFIQCAPGGYEELQRSSPDLGRRLGDFIQHQLEDWLRWMCIIGKISVVLNQLARLCDWLKAGPLWIEARRVYTHAQSQTYQESVPFCWPHSLSPRGDVEDDVILSNEPHLTNDAPSSQGLPLSSIPSLSDRSMPNGNRRDTGPDTNLTYMGFGIARRFASMAVDLSASAVLRCIQPCPQMPAEGVETSTQGLSGP